MSEDQEMTREEELAYLRAEWYGIIGQLWTALGKQIDQDRIKLYGQVLGPIPMGLLQQAITNVLRSGTYQVIPLPGVVWGEVHKILGRPGDMEWAIENWKNAQDARIPGLIENRERRAISQGQGKEK